VIAISGGGRVGFCVLGLDSLDRLLGVSFGDCWEVVAMLARHLFVVASLVLAGVTACSDSTESDDKPGVADDTVGVEVSEGTVAAEPTPAAVEVVYADDYIADIYAPTEGDSWPVVVTAHGGWSDRTHTAELAQAISERGAVVYNPNLPYGMPYLEMIEHLACVVRLARNTAADHGGDGDHVALFGFSMGAYSGTMVALSGDDHHLSSCAVDTGSAMVDALVAYEGPYNWAISEEHNNLVPELEQTDPDAWATLNPYSHIGRNMDLRVRLLNGVDEDIRINDIRPEVAEEFARALADAGYDVELVLVDDAAHYIGQPGFPQWEAILENTIEVMSS
jgi:acetyl esterase/lipase